MVVRTASINRHVELCSNDTKDSSILPLLIFFDCDDNHFFTAIDMRRRRFFFVASSSPLPFGSRPRRHGLYVED